MEIDISIRNASQDELRQLFKGLLTSVRVGTAANFQSERWSPEEKDAIAGCTGSDEAWENYHEKFPDSPRTQDAVRRMHQNIKVPAPPEEPTPIIKKIRGIATKESNAKNAAAPRWTDPEKEIIKRHVGDKDSAAAWKDYQEKFPGQRGEHAIYLKWYAYRQQGKKDKPAVREKSATTGQFQNKWQIPFSAKKVDGKVPPEYYKAWAMCRKYNKPYPEALKLKEAADVSKRQKKPEKVPVPTVPDQEQKDTIDTPPVGDGVTTKSPQSNPGPVPARHITRGDKVRHITAYPLFPGIGTVVKTSTNGKEVMVDFGNGTEWLDRKNLELVPLEAKA